MRILALDWGTVRIGAAISDPDGKMAFPLDKFINAATAFDEIKSIVTDKEVGQILVGIPKSLSGENTTSTESALKFVDQLKVEIGIEVETIDERLSSIGAHKALTLQGLNQKQQREEVDNIAAAQMLQSHLDTKINKN